MRIAVVGAGVSGLTAAWLLQAENSVTLLEASPRAGGHAHTVEIEHEGRAIEVDTGFVVFNHATYPRFTALLARLGVASQPASMSFSVRNESSGLEYCGSGWNGLFAQRRNLLRPRFHGMLRDIVRFNRTAESAARQLGDEATLADLLAAGRYGRPFIDDYLVPMASAIWSTPATRMTTAPAGFIVGFLRNHGMLSVDGHLQWRTVVGGSRRYVDALVSALHRPPELATPVARVRRLDDGVEVLRASGERSTFDAVVLATHTDQALALIEDAGFDERRALRAVRYEESAATLHCDATLLPRSRRAWASWNYHAGGPGAAGNRPVALTYDMSRLQQLATRSPVLVTLNRDDRIDPAKVYARMRYAHPQFDLEAAAAQRRLRAMSGAQRIHFCGAWLGNGFHEDGVASAYAVAGELGARRAA